MFYLEGFAGPIWLIEIFAYLHIGCDEKGCKMDVDCQCPQRQRSTRLKMWSTKKSAVVDVDGIFHDQLLKI